MWNPFDDEETEEDASSPEALADLVDTQRSVLISVATGGPRIDDVEREYKRRHRKLKQGLDHYGIAPPFKWSSLWDWYGYYSGKLGSYAERRAYINQLADTALEELEKLQTHGKVSDWGDTLETPGAVPENWGTINLRLEELKKRVGTATSTDDNQDVGRRSREIIIAAVNLVFRPEMVPPGDEVPKGADAKNRLEHVMNSLVPGTAHAELRKLLRAALEVAHKVTHSDGVTRVDAFAAAQATVLVVRTLSEMTTTGAH